MPGPNVNKFEQDFMRAQARRPVLMLPPKPSIRMVNRPTRAEEEFLNGVARKSFRVPRLFGAIGG